MNKDSKMLNDIVTQLSSLHDEKTKVLSAIQRDIDAINNHVSESISAAKQKYETEVAEIKSHYAIEIETLQEKIKSINSEIVGINKAVTALNHQRITPQPKVKVSSDDEVPSETIYDFIIDQLFKVANGMTLKELGDICKNRGLIAEGKNVLNTMVNIIGNLRKEGIINRVNDYYVLSDKEEGKRRTVVRQTVFRIVQQQKSSVTVKDVVKDVLQFGLLNQKDVNRRVRGHLIWMTKTGHLIKTKEDNIEKFSVAVAA